MAQGEIEIIRRSLQAFNRRDANGMIESIHPDGEMFPFRAQLEGQVYRGHDGIRRFIEDMYEDWSSFEVEIDEFQELRGRVLAIGHIEGISRGSGVAVGGEAGFLFEFRDGLIIKAVSYSDPAEARREACA
jgi:ketosteroid isomerase-like protein